MDEHTPPSKTGDHENTAPTFHRRLTIRNEKGLHARASAKLAETAGQFQSAIRVRKNGFDVCATSIMGLLMLGAGCGQCIDVHIEGADADAALQAIVALVDSGFGEGLAAQPPAHGIPSDSGGDITT